MVQLQGLSLPAPVLALTLILILNNETLLSSRQRQSQPKLSTGTDPRTGPIDSQAFTVSTDIEGLAIIPAPLPILVSLVFPGPRFCAPQIVAVANHDKKKALR